MVPRWRTNPLRTALRRFFKNTATPATATENRRAIWRWIPTKPPRMRWPIPRNGRRCTNISRRIKCRRRTNRSPRRRSATASPAGLTASCSRLIPPIPIRAASPSTGSTGRNMTTPSATSSAWIFIRRTISRRTIPATASTTSATCFHCRRCSWKNICRRRTKFWTRPFRPSRSKAGHSRSGDARGNRIQRAGRPRRRLGASHQSRRGRCRGRAARGGG